jgi:hypothetical protein
LEWIENSKLLDLKLNPADYIFIPWILESKIFEATFSPTDELVDHTFSNKYLQL